MDYQGFKPTKGWKVPKIKCSEISPEQFFNDYVIPRKPAILTGPLPDKSWRGAQWDLEYLSSKAGSCEVKVEPIGKNGYFGTGVKREVQKFSEFLRKISEGQEGLYLTTQYAEEDGELFGSDYPRDWQKVREVCPPPNDALVDDFPLQPKVLGNLIPQQVNLWIGCSANGTSSGLHHDFHDNLYVLLKGRKRFTLFAPSDQPYLYLNGAQPTVHPNGLICFAGGFTMRQDGAPLVDIAEWRVEQLKQALSEMRAGGADSKSIDECKRELKKATAEMRQWQEKEGDGSESDEGEFELLRELGLERKKGGKKSEEAPSKMPKVDESDGKEHQPGSIMALFDMYESMKGKLPEAKKPAEPEKAVEEQKEDPPSFCKVPVPLLHDPKAAKEDKKFPLLKKATKVVCELEEGDMLWLPASWFHEVTSYSSGDSRYHMAFNFWMHPPSGTDFELPYEDAFWLDKFVEVQEVIAAKKSAPANSAEKTMSVFGREKRKVQVVEIDEVDAEIRERREHGCGCCCDHDHDEENDHHGHDHSHGSHNHHHH